jgi:MYXO-CTERM domain-containing protein
MTGTHNALPRAGVILAFTYFLALAFAAVYIANRSYAPWPDEMWSYPDSVAMYRGNASEGIRSFPLFGRYFLYLSGEYQGSYKTYLHLIFLIITGGAGEHQRYINALLYVGVGLSTAWALWPIARGWLCAIPVLILASEPNYVTFMPSDYGPFLLQNLFTVLAFGFLLRAWHTRRPGYLAGALACASAIAGDKLTGIPVAAGIIAVCGYLALKRREALISPRLVGVYLIALLVPVLPFVVFFARGGFASTLRKIGGDTLLVRLENMERELHGMISGNYSYLFADIYEAVARIGVPHYFLGIGAVALVMICACALDPKARRSPAALALTLLAAIFAIAVVLFLCVPGLGRPWNYLIFCPIMFMAMATVVVWAIDYARSIDRAAPRLAVLGALLLAAANLLIAQYNVVGQLAYQTRHSGKALESMAIYPLIAKLEELGVTTAICIDYGPCPSIHLLTGGRISVVRREDSPNFDNEPLGELLRQPNSALVVRQVFGLRNRNYARWIQLGASWFFSAPLSERKLPPVDVVQMERLGDTRFTLVLARH